MKKIILLAIVLLSLSGCSNPVPQQGVDPTQIENARQTLVAGMQLTEIVGLQMIPTLQPANDQFTSVGSISGSLSYPSEFLPGLLIIAYRSGTAEFYSMATVDGQATYQIDNLPPGTYHVVAYYQTLSAGYSQAVPCGLSVNCTDHSLIDVIVVTGSVTMDVNPTDWYAPAGTFPAKP